MFIRNKSAALGLILLLGVIVMTLFGATLYPVDPFDIVWAPFTPPGDVAMVPLGTDYLGRDVLAGIIKGGGATLAVGASAAMLTVFIGITIGAFAGFHGGVVDEVLMRITEFFQVLPPLLFAMVLVALFSPTLTTVAIAIGVVSWPQTGRQGIGQDHPPHDAAVLGTDRARRRDIFQLLDLEELGPGQARRLGPAHHADGDGLNDAFNPKLRER